jgi:DNA-binding response OmpR family regulator
MARPTFLIIEQEQPEGLSSRKLVIETAKYNVLTAYSGTEGLEIFARHPVEAVVVHASIRDVPCTELIKRLKEQRPKTPVVVITPSLSYGCDSADREIGSHNPQELLEVLRDVIAT